MLDGPHSSESIPSSTGLTVRSGSFFDDWTFLTVSCTTKGKFSKEYYPCEVLTQTYSYTSLGSTYNTFPNPALLIQSKTPAEAQEVNATKSDLSLQSLPHYQPAYELTNGELERAGRAIAAKAVPPVASH